MGLAVDHCGRRRDDTIVHPWLEWGLPGRSDKAIKRGHAGFYYHKKILTSGGLVAQLLVAPVAEGLGNRRGLETARLT